MKQTEYGTYLLSFPGSTLFFFTYYSTKKGVCKETCSIILSSFFVKCRSKPFFIGIHSLIDAHPFLYHPGYPLGLALKPLSCPVFAAVDTDIDIRISRLHPANTPVSSLSRTAKPDSRPFSEVKGPGSARSGIGLISWVSSLRDGSESI